jgi:hypothetical protein
LRVDACGEEAAAPACRGSGRRARGEHALARTLLQGRHGCEGREAQMGGCRAEVAGAGGAIAVLCAARRARAGSAHVWSARRSGPFFAGAGAVARTGPGSGLAQARPRDALGARGPIPTGAVTAVAVGCTGILCSRSTLPTRIRGSIGRVAARAVRAPSKGRRAGQASCAAFHVAAEAVDAVVALALTGNVACRA